MYDGSVMASLNYKDDKDDLDIIKVGNIESIAVSYINSYANPKHEIETEEYLRSNRKCLS
ncbi:MAG: hydantoinase/oxoprolinase N-terminal domain-containing protein [Vulcanisaeta sp.]|uniref:hydantoinase/oxoprolinase N-terminal domain-containing protein n=1 Tax=Vulcanisaeta sp. TaxID=2020871 RepID=UPI003D1051C7